MKKETVIAKSIIEKNLESGIDNKKRGIFIHSLADTTRKDLISDGGTIVIPVYQLLDEQKKMLLIVCN